MKIVNDLRPLNLLEQKLQFFANPTVNPVFSYARTFTTEELTQFGLPSQAMKQLAQHIVDRAFFNNTEAELFAMEGRKLTKDEVNERTRSYLERYALADMISIEWSADFVARTAIGSNRIGFRLPCDFREEGFVGMLHHEIGTHALRNLNYHRQPWFGKKKKFGFKSHLLTEEGMAVLHGQLPHTNQLLYIAALRYLAIWHAQRGSFLDVWNALSAHVTNVERRWIICTRAKRGLTDTSLPGGFTKDLVYLNGAVRMYQWLKKNTFKIEPLYFGKIAVEDIEKARSFNPEYVPVVPHFYTDNPTQYAELITAIAKVNDFDAVNNNSYE